MTSLLLHRLVDHAGIFPPERAPMPEAVSRHRVYAAGPHAALLGRFLCAASRLSEMQAELVDGDDLEVGVVCDQGPEGVAAAVEAVASDPRLRLGSVELPLRSGPSPEQAAAEAVEVLAGLPGFVEIPRVPGWQEALEVVAAAGLGAKLRTGGLTPEAFPAQGEVSAFIGACVERGVGFKCTAGLHHGVRHLDPATGFTHHGFLNLLAATGAALLHDDVESWVTETDGRRLAAWVQRLGDDEAQAVRRHFVAFGSCSFTEPVEDLVGLGLVEAGVG